MIQIDHLSPSSIGQYMKCSVQWFYRRTIGPKPPTIALLYGSSVDDAINVDMEQKVESHKDLKSNDVMDAFVSSWDKRKEDTKFFPSDKPDELRETGLRSVENWLTDVAPTIQPKAVQEELSFEAEDSKIVQYADLITEDGTIIDNKTAGRSPGEHISHDHRIQLTMYGMGYEHKNVFAPKELGLDYMIKTKTPKVQRVRWKPNGSDVNLANSMIGQVKKSIEKGVFIPNRGNFMCTKRFCGYWRECQQEFGGTVKP